MTRPQQTRVRPGSTRTVKLDRSEAIVPGVGSYSCLVAISFISAFVIGQSRLMTDVVMTLRLLQVPPRRSRGKQGSVLTNRLCSEGKCQTPAKSSASPVSGN